VLSWIGDGREEDQGEKRGAQPAPPPAVTMFAKRNVTAKRTISKEMERIKPSRRNATYSAGKADE